ncbi:MAG: S8 family serine peptidase [Trueperaceae bacterium]
MKRHRSNPGITPAARGLLLGILGALLTTLLAGCSNVSNAPSAEQSRLTGDGPAYLLTVDLGAFDTREEIEQRYGGEVVVWAEGAFAVVGLDSEDASGSVEFSLQGTGAAVEANIDFSTGHNAVGMQGTSGLWAGGTSSIWAGGTSSIWAGGTSSLWAGGTSYLWAGGEYAWMPQNTDLWRHIGLEEAHLLVEPSFGAGINVAVVDTGLDSGHPAFHEAVGPGYDFIDNDDDPQEEGDERAAGYGHGTNVAGIVRQVAPRATIIPLRILDSNGVGDAADLAKAIIWAVDEGDADIINLSLGGAKHVRAVEAALRYATSKSVFVVTSTGDSGGTDVTYPAREAHVGRKAQYMISLASVDTNDVKSDFSPYHPREVEMSAPGEFVFGPAPGVRGAAWSGTSMSAPMAAGALALALGAERAGMELQVSKDRLGAALLSSSTDIDALNDRKYRRKLGEGRLDVTSFLESVLGTSSDRGSSEGPDERDDEREEDDDRPNRGRSKDKGEDGDRGKDNDRDRSESRGRGR